MPTLGIVRDPTDEKVTVVAGGAFTVRVNEREAERAPSLTKIVIVAVPVWPAAGVTVTVRPEPLPPKTILAVGTKVVLAEVPVSVRPDAGVSASLMVTPRAVVEVPATMD